MTIAETPSATAMIHLLPKAAAAFGDGVAPWGDGMIRPATALPSIRDAGFAEALAAALDRGAEMLILADCRGASDLQQCDVMVSVAEARAGLAAGTVRIVASVADSAEGVLKLASLPQRSKRLAALTWDRPALAEELGIETDAAAIDHAGHLLLFAARAACVPALERAGMGGQLSPLLAESGRHGFAGLIVMAPA